MADKQNDRLWQNNKRKTMADKQNDYSMADKQNETILWRTNNERLFYGRQTTKDYSMDSQTEL